MTEAERQAAIEELLACADTWNVWMKRDRDIAPVLVETGGLAAKAELKVDRLVKQAGGVQYATEDCPSNVAACYLEAAALLIDGWCPGAKDDA